MRRNLLLINSTVRMAYGIAVTFSPTRSATTQLAPDTSAAPETRLFVRGFAAHQIAVAAVGLASLRQPRLERPAMALAVAIDVADVVSAALEGLERGQADRDVVGGGLFSAAGLVTAAAALRRTENR